MTEKSEKLVWRLKEKPTVDNVGRLVDVGIITKEEAKDILFNDTADDAKKIAQLETDLKAKDEEIKFLRELSDKLARQSNNFQTIVHEYREYTPSYPRWYKRYEPNIITCENKFGPQILNANIKDLMETKASDGNFSYAVGNNTNSYQPTALLSVNN